MASTQSLKTWNHLLYLPLLTWGCVYLLKNEYYQFYCVSTTISSSTCTCLSCTWYIIGIPGLVLTIFRDVFNSKVSYSVVLFYVSYISVFVGPYTPVSFLLSQLQLRRLFISSLAPHCSLFAQISQEAWVRCRCISERAKLVSPVQYSHGGASSSSQVFNFHLLDIIAQLSNATCRAHLVCLHLILICVNETSNIENSVVFVNDN